MSKPPDNAKGGPLSETAPRKTLAREFDSSSSVKDPKKVLGELANHLQSQWLRHDVLFRALGGEADNLAAQKFARFADAVRQAEAELLPAWLDGNELLAFARQQKKEARSCR